MILKLIRLKGLQATDKKGDRNDKYNANNQPK